MRGHDGMFKKPSTINQVRVSDGRPKRRNMGGMDDSTIDQDLGWCVDDERRPPRRRTAPFPRARHRG